MNFQLQGIWAKAKPFLKEYLQLVGFRRMYEISFWLNYSCVYDCPYCILDKKGSEMLDKKLVFRYMDEAIPMKLGNVIVTGGEPLLHPDFSEICNGVLDRELELNISTTGHTKNVDELMPLAERGATINICINSHKAEVNDWLRGKGALEASSELAKKLHSLNASYRGSIVITRPNMDHFRETADYMFDELGCPSITIYMGTPNGSFLRHAPELLLGDEEIALFYGNLTDAVRYYNEKEKRLVPIGLFNKPVRYCGAFGSANVLPDGLIMQCCYFFDDQIALGNTKQSLREAHSFRNYRRVKRIVMDNLKDSEERIKKVGAFSCYDCMVAYKSNFQGIDISKFAEPKHGPGKKSAAD